MVSVRSILPCVVVVVVMTAVGITGTVQRKITSDSCVNITNETPAKRKNCYGVALMVAAAKGDLRQIEDVLEKRDTSYVLAYTENQGIRKGYTALFWAAEKNHSKAVEMLVKAGADVNHTSSALFTVVYLLAENGALSSLELVLEKNAVSDVRTRRGHTPLIMAAWYGYPEVVKLLLEKDANPNASTPNTLYSPLYFAAKSGNVEIVRSLLAAGADPNNSTSWGITPLLAAAVWERQPVVPLLLQAGADPNKKEKDGHTALHKAVYYRQLEMVKNLLDGGAQLDIQDNFGRTALHYSVVTKRDEKVTRKTGEEARRRLADVENTKLQVLRELLNRCPRTDLRDSKGKTALDVARLGSSTNLQQALQGYKRSTC